MAEDIARGMMDNASKCLSNGALPLGYKAGENGRIVLDKAQAAVVQEIYTRVACREPFVDIAADLNQCGIKTKRGGPWTKSSFYTICRNERYRGIYIYDDVRVEGGVPRIVSDGLFYRVQEVLKVKKTPQSSRHHTGAEDYLLTGKLFCGKCGRAMTGVSGTSRSGEVHYYYTCQKRRREHACDKKNVIREQIEKSVAQAIKQYTANHFGGFLVHKPVFPFFVPQIAVNDSAGQVLAAHAFGLEHGADFPAGVAGVKLVHTVAEGGKIIIAFQTVHTVVDGDQPDAALPQNLHDLGDFQIVTPQAAHVFDNNGLHPSGLDFLHHRQKAGAVKTSSRYAVISEVGGVRQPIPAGKIL